MKTEPRPASRMLPLLCAATALVLSPALSQAATQAELEARVDALAAQLTALQKELAALKAQPAPAVASTPAVATTGARPAASATASDATPALGWFGYGELTYARPRADASAAVADVGRFVIGTAYQFDDRTRMVSELEVEHAVSSSSDPGEIEVEQAYVERQLDDHVALRAGLFLMPVGLLNESHEPTRYFGVFRNHVETAIIPTTWREGGVLLNGDTESGFRWNVGFTTGFDLNKWDPASTEGQESPLGSIHQELALARAADIAGVVALNWQGRPGWLLGGSLFTGNTTQRVPGAPGGRVTLWEGHARWTPGPFEFSALYARGHIADAAQLNTPLVGNPVLIPSSFYGAYLEASVRAVQTASYSLTPFLRVERLNTGAHYASIAPGLTPDALPTETVWTGGVNWMLGQGVVFKADYQAFDKDSSRDQFSLGVGYQF